jgi:DNA-binding response OmpR family regulator
MPSHRRPRPLDPSSAIFAPVLLVVEPEGGGRRIGADLERFGFDVLPTPSRYAALRLSSSRALDAVVLLDRSGADLPLCAFVRELRSLRPDLPVLRIGGQEEDERICGAWLPGDADARDIERRVRAMIRPQAA